MVTDKEIDDAVDRHNAYVPEQLRAAAAIYEQRNALYGDNYLRFGPIMALLFPDGLHLQTADDFNRFGVFTQMMAKNTRYAAQFTAGGHDDSLDDNTVYSMMLKEIDHMIKSRPKKRVRRSRK